MAHNYIINITIKIKRIERRRKNMGYQQIKDLISDIDEFHNEAELREIIQQILFICEDNIKKEPSTDSQIEK